MKIATTTADFSGYFSSDVDLLKQLHLAGFKHVDLSLYSVQKINSVYSDDNYALEVENLKNTAEKLNIDFVLAHLPGDNGANPIVRNEKFNDYLKATLRSIEICGMLGIKHAVYHLGLERGLSKEESFIKNHEFLKLLFPTLEKWGVTILAENSTGKNTYDIYYPNSGKDLKEFVDYVNHKNVGACWDTGHANCEGSQYDDILALGNSLKAIHYNDNHGECDEHVIPYLGTLNHDEVISALIDVNYNGYFTLEATSSLVKPCGWPHKRREFEKSNKLANAPLFIQQDLEKLMFKTAKYLLETYGVYEE